MTWHRLSPAAENGSLTCPSWGLLGVIEEFLESRVSVESVTCKEQNIMKCDSHSSVTRPRLFSAAVLRYSPNLLKCVKHKTRFCLVFKFLSAFTLFLSPPFLFSSLLSVVLSHCCLHASLYQPYTLDFVNIWNYHTSEIKLWAWRPDNQAY